MKDTLTQFYKEYGVGRFGLHKSFRVCHDEQGHVEIRPILNIAHVHLDDLVGYDIIFHHVPLRHMQSHYHGREIIVVKFLKYAYIVQSGLIDGSLYGSSDLTAAAVAVLIDLNLCRIESRPIEDRSWEYRFFIDFEGNLADSAVKNALRGLRDVLLT